MNYEIETDKSNIRKKGIYCEKCSMRRSELIRLKAEQLLLSTGDREKWLRCAQVNNVIYLKKRRINFIRTKQ